MDRILAMQVYVRVVEAKSFVRAAEALSMPPSTVTGLIKGLEKHLRVRPAQSDYAQRQPHLGRRALLRTVPRDPQPD